MSKLDAIAGIVKKAALKSAEGLPMDKASRMARAKRMGFDTSKTYYHGTKADIDAFDPNALGASTGAQSARKGYFFATDAATASDYANIAPGRTSLRAAAGDDAAAEISDVTGLKRLHLEEKVKTLERSSPEQTKKYLEQLKTGLGAIQNELSGKTVPKFPRPKDYLIQKESEYLQKIADAEAELTPAGMKKYEQELAASQNKLRAVEMADAEKHTGQNVLPVKLKTKNPYVHDFKGQGYRDTPYSEIMDQAKKAGHDSVIFKNTYDPADPNNRVKQDIVAVFDPSQIRSVNAAFDPKKAKSGNILAGLGGAALLGGASMALGSEAQAAEPEAKGSRAELIEQAKAKFRREQLIAQAKQKWAERNPAVEPPAPSQLPEQLETGGRSVLESMSLGLSEPAISGVNAAIQTAIDAGLEGDLGQLSVENLKEEYARDVARRRSMKEQHPSVDLGGQLVGAFSPGTLAAKATTAGAKLGKALLPAAVEKIPVVSKLASGAAQAAGGTLAQELPQQVIERASGHRVADEGPDLSDAASSSAKIGAGMSALGMAAGQGTKLGLGAVSALAGNVSPQRMKQYLDWKRAGGEDISMLAAKGKLDDAVEFARQEAQGMKGDFADTAVNAVSRLKDRVVKGSQDAYAILENTAGEIPTASLKRSVTEAKKEVLGPAGVVIGPTSRAAVASLNSLREDINALPKTIDLVTAKSILQRLDDSISWSGQAGEFGQLGSNAFKSVRANLDAVVKRMSPEYAAKMEDVAAATRQLSNISGNFGTVEAAQRRIPQLMSGKDIIQKNAMQYLDEQTGSKLGDMLTEIQKREVIAAMRPGQTEGFLKSVISDKSIENKAKLAMLSKMQDQDLVKMADDLAMSTVFDREFRAGSQHVNFWTVLGGLTLGGIIDESGMGMGGGAVLGVLTTKFGPRATKALLDGVAKMHGMPTVQKIEKLNVPEEMRRELKMSLLRTMNTFKDYSPVKVPASQAVFMQSDIRSSDALTPMQKAKALDQLARGEGLDPTILRTLMLGEDRARPDYQRRGKDIIDRGMPSGTVQR